jgi:uncharacterized protein YchJ
MDIDTGQIRGFESEEAMELLMEKGERLVALSEHDARTLTPMSNGRRKNWMRNQPCVCGSGKKFKKCCWTR